MTTIAPKTADPKTPAIRPPADDQGFETALAASADTRAGRTETATSRAEKTVEVAQASANPTPGTPSAYFIGAAAGARVPPGWRGGAFVLAPPGNSFLDFDAKDGTPANTIFLSKNVQSGIDVKVGKLEMKFSHGAVGTYNPATGEIQPGYGGTFSQKILGIPVIGFINTRATVNGDFTGTVSGNFGFGFSMDQAAATALGTAAKGAALVPHPKAGAAAAGMKKAHDVLRDIGEYGNAFTGAAYRVELRFEKGQLQGIYHNGQRIHDLGKFMEDALTGARYRPPVIPNEGVPEIANLNSTIQLAFGTSPWDLAAKSGGKNHGNGAVAVANAWRSTIIEFGMKYASLLPSDLLPTTLLGPRSMAEAGRAVNALLAVATPEDARAITQRLVNRYDLDFGVSAVKFLNGIDDLLPKPGDYAFVRGAFEGRFRFPDDNPLPVPAPRDGIRL